MREKTLILGMGNPILADGGVGLEVAQEVSRKIVNPDVDIAEASVGGFDIVDKISGYKRVIIVDGTKTGDAQPGAVSKLNLEDCRATTHLSAAHTLDLATALALAEKYGYDLPESIEIYGIEIEDNTSFQEGCTELVREAAHRVAAEIVERLSHRE